MTEKTMIQVIMQLSDAYPHKGDEIKPLLKLMADKLSKYPLSVVTLAVDEHITSSKYFPAISELVALCNKHQRAGKYNHAEGYPADNDFGLMREELYDQTLLTGVDVEAWQELIKTARHLNKPNAALYLELKLDHIQNYSWPAEKAKWELAELEEVAI